MENYFNNIVENHINAVRDTINFCKDDILNLSFVITNAFKNNNRLFLFGNGGSAADAQHVAAEFVNRFKKERIPLPAISLTTDTSILSAISNDYSFEDVFSKQIYALCNKGDVAIGISTSGNSPNVIKGLRAAREKGAKTASFVGARDCVMKDISDIVISVKSIDTPRIQEVHIFIFHILCELVEMNF